MAIISSFFGEQTPPAGVGGFAVGAEIPKELKPYYTDLMSKAQALYNQRTAAGYQPYTGPSLAPFSPEQEQAFSGLQGLVGGVAPKFDEAATYTRGAAAPITTEQIEEYMSPYQQAVVDIEKREAQKQFETGVVPQLAQQAAQAQAFGGSRQGILEGMAADTQQRLLADIQAKGSAQAYQDAVKRLEAERSRSGQAGAQLATMAPQQFKTELGELGALQTVGEERQKQTQAALNEAYRQFAKEQQFPYETMGKYQSVITGAPMAQTQYIQPQAQPSMTQQLLGGLGTMVGTYGAFGGFSPGGLFGKNAKTGGGIADLPVIKAQDGTEGGLRKRHPNLFGIQTRPTYRDLFEKQKLSNIDVRGRSGFIPWLDEKNEQLVEAMNWRKALERLGHNVRGYNYFEDKPDVSQEKTYFRDPSRNPIWDASKAEEMVALEQTKDEGISLQDKALDMFKNIKDKVLPYHYLDKHQILKRHLSTPEDPSHFRDPSENPIWQEDDRGLLSILKSKASDTFRNIKDKGADWWQDRIEQQNIKEAEAAEALRPREVNPLYAERPPIHADIESIDTRTPFEHDIDTTKKVLVEASGEVLDVAEVVANYGIDALNYLREKGSRYFLGKASTDIPSLEDDTLREVYNIPPDPGEGLSDMAFSAHGTTEKGILPFIESRLERVDENIKKFTNKYSEDIWTKLTKDKYLGNVESLADVKKDTKRLFETLTNTSIIHNEVDGITGANNPEEFVLNLENNTLDSNQVDEVLKIIPKTEEIEENTKIIANANDNKTNVIKKDLDELKENEQTYQDALDDSKDDPDNKKKQSNLDTAYDKYLTALETYNSSLGDKKALINSAEKESFFAFLAQISSRYGAGENLISAAGKELPNAMKSRQKFIQARSDLDDKIDQGVVKIAKAEMDIEKDKTAAVIAAEKERVRQFEKSREDMIKWVKVIADTKGKTIPYKLTTKSALDLHGVFVTDTIAHALKFGDTRFIAPTILDDRGTPFKGKDLRKLITGISDDKHFQSTVLSKFEQIANQYAEDNVLNKSPDDIMLEAINDTMQNLPTRYTRKNRSFWKKVFG